MTTDGDAAAQTRLLWSRKPPGTWRTCKRASRCPHGGFSQRVNLKPQQMASIGCWIAEMTPGIARQALGNDFQWSRNFLRSIRLPFARHLSFFGGLYCSLLLQADL